MSSLWATVIITSAVAEKAIQLVSQNDFIPSTLLLTESKKERIGAWVLSAIFFK